MKRRNNIQVKIKVKENKEAMKEIRKKTVKNDNL